MPRAVVSAKTGSCHWLAWKGWSAKHCQTCVQFAIPWSLLGLFRGRSIREIYFKEQSGEVDRWSGCSVAKQSRVTRLFVYYGRGTTTTPFFSPKRTKDVSERTDLYFRDTCQNNLSKLLYISFEGFA